MTEGSGRIGVAVDVGTEILDYEFEYYGVPQATFLTPYTNRMTFNFIAAISRSKCKN